MIYTVTLNPSLDYIVTVPVFTPGMVNRTTEEMLYPGGKGINVSLVLKNLGIESTAIGFIAGFTGEELTNRLRKYGICTEFIQVKEGLTRINVKVRSEQESEINGKGPLISKGELRLLFNFLETLQENDILVLGGSVPESIPSTLYMEIMKNLRGRNIKIVVDATKDLLLNVLNYNPFLIKPNHHELGEIFGKKLITKTDVVEYAGRLKAMGAQNVLVSMAGDGAVMITETGEVYETNAPKGIVKNSVGAGDSMVAGFLAGYLKTKDYKEAFKMGVCSGSASAFSDGMAKLEEVFALMKDGCFDEQTLLLDK
ncbi:1-phosphofructokinase [Anaerocolumna sp. AGMB13020]|uniref:1-phosphofructokinase n=1 Tax=Anaerocolumna sp. AGMB13020 TaxID=3081750 RepID=UPI002955B6C1|nr:1-phosphofructokinase [Anaerocolumna sp. AGMB13020]WOO37609.1 1-phosphofructokinase [Anaerocolumna sp. AGMB13020]